VKKLKLYLETTVFNRYFEPDSDNYADTQQLFAEIAAKKFDACTSQYVVDELMDACDPKRTSMINLITQHRIRILQKSGEIEALADEYARQGMITERHLLDRQHIACASVHGMDAIISLNFNHINRMKTKRMLPHINQLNGYANIIISVPMEVTNYEDE